MRFSKHTSFAVCVSVLCGCASGGSHAAGSASWSGSFRQPQQAASAVVGPATTPRGAAYGSLNLLPTGKKANAYRVELSVSAPVDPNAQLAWAIFTGPCGAPSPSVIGLNEFPIIEMTSGNGGYHGELTLPLDSRASYHANVYWTSRATDVSTVMMCTNLSYSG